MRCVRKLREIASWMAQDLATQIALTEEISDGATPCTSRSAGTASSS
jgi:hypothetical protein